MDRHVFLVICWQVRICGYINVYISFSIDDTFLLYVGITKINNGLQRLTYQENKFTKLIVIDLKVNGVSVPSHFSYCTHSHHTLICCKQHPTQNGTNRLHIFMGKAKLDKLTNKRINTG